MDCKASFLEKLFQLFVLHGAKTLTMDDIAREFSISKKTLYQLYKNKEALLADVLNFISDKVLHEMEKIENQSSCPIQSLFERNNVINEVLGSEKNLFIMQLMKYYLEVYHHHLLKVHSKMTNLIENNFASGLEKKLYCEDVPREMYARFLITLFFSIDTSPLFETCDAKEKEGICKDVLNFYLDAILTEKGKERKKELLSEFKILTPNNIDEELS